MSKQLLNPYLANCPTRAILDRIADKWTVLVIGLLDAGPVRFNQLRKAIDGISQKVLTQVLRGLEADGMITRSVFPSVPVRVEYALTPLGRSLAATLQPLRHWAEANYPAIQRARAKAMRHAEAG
jgi:DNA-binding HxlR family transcriptional regulator